MKSFLIIFIMLLSFGVFAGHQVVNVTVKGMVCSFCAQGIEKKFLSEPAVDKINVSLENHLVSLTLKHDHGLKDEKIKTLLKDSGFTVEKIERER